VAYCDYKHSYKGTMGIPFYFGEVIAKSPVSRRFQTITSNIPYSCARMFLDFNSVIHMCSADIVSQPCNSTCSYEQLQRRIFENIAEYTLKLIQFSNPTELVYIAIDGVAPRAKMVQQRKRRFLSAKRNIAIEDFKKKHGIPFIKWDSNCITPGTQFMTELAQFLNTDFREMVAIKFPHLQHMQVSTADEEGEGEHKMIHYIKANPLQKQASDESDVCDVIYGLDADLIMLSLTCTASNIVLMRESNNFINDKAGQKMPFKYLVIDRLRESIIETFGDGVKHTSKEDLVLDYVFLCFFLGNDFIPSLSFLKIQESAVDVLVNTYKAICVEEGIISQDGNMYSINIHALEMFLNELRKIEDNMMVTTHEHFYNLTVHPPRNFNNIVSVIRQQSQHITLKEAQTKAVKEFINDLDKFPLRNKPSYHFDPRNDTKWRNSYYHYVLGANTPELISDTCNNYIDGLLWTTNYYFNSSGESSWYYKYAYAPCASDLFKHIVSTPPDGLHTRQKELFGTNNQPISPYLQLLMVLPPQSISLLPIHLQPLMKDITKGCLHYYPNEFKVETYLKHKGWECSPILPLVDMKRLQSRLSQAS
jgi:5'-3' exonuclease